MIPTSLLTRLASSAAVKKSTFNSSSTSTTTATRFVSVLACDNHHHKGQKTISTVSSSSRLSSSIPSQTDSILVRWKSSGSGSSKKSSSSSFRPRRAPGKDYYRSHQQKQHLVGKPKKVKGPKEPYDVSTPVPQIDLNKINITDVDADVDADEAELFGPLIGDAIRNLQMQAKKGPSGEVDIESQLRMMDFFTSAPGSTEDLVGSRRAISLEALDGENTDDIMAEIDRLVDQERIDYMDLPPTDPIGIDDINREVNKGSNQIPSNQLAHGEW